MSIHVGIFGPSLCGKTTAAKILSLARWRGLRRPSLVLDLNNEDWGSHALVYTLPERIRNPPPHVNISQDERAEAVAALVNVFLGKVWASRDCDVFIDEATETVGRSTDFTGVFTRARHRGHVVYAMGHAATVLLPIQRDQFGSLLLFRQSPQAAAVWEREWADVRIRAATEQKKFHFLLCRKFGASDGNHFIKPSVFPADFLPPARPSVPANQKRLPAPRLALPA